MFAVGTRVRIKEDNSGCGLRKGEVVIVDVVDDDGTFRPRRARDARLMMGWVPWKSVEAAGPQVGWEFLRDALTPGGRRLLEAFEGHDRLTLSARAEDALVESLPNLDAVIVEEADTLGDSPTHQPARKQKPRRDSPTPMVTSPNVASPTVAEAVTPAPNTDEPLVWR